MRSVRIAIPLLTLIGGCATAARNPPVPQDAGPEAADGLYTEEQAARGETVFAGECAACHGVREFSGRGFQLSWSGSSLADFYDLVRSTMPFDAPGRLTGQQYVDVLAYVVSLNGYPAGDEELPSDPEALQSLRFE